MPGFSHRFACLVSAHVLAVVTIVQAENPTPPDGPRRPIESKSIADARYPIFGPGDEDQASTEVMMQDQLGLTRPEIDDDGQEDDWAMSTPALKMAASGACVLPVVWLIAQSPMKGQVIAATIIGSIAAGFVGRMIAPTVQPVLLFASVCVFGALGQWVAGMWLPEDPNVMVAAGTLPHIVLPLPIDYAAGALIGIPIGLSWSNGFLEKDDATNQAAAA